MAVQERSQQHKPPQLVKETADNSHRAHLKLGKEFRFVGKPVVSHFTSVSVPSFNRFDLLSDCEENLSLKVVKAIIIFCKTFASYFKCLMVK